jgi:hypothetical protein
MFVFYLIDGEMKAKKEGLKGGYRVFAPPATPHI